ncbi:hypothetical protein FM106_05045 [Brachybacterium faecium]|nr:hypothetical protein FM106_05045 [Brachybacterium faecium]
MPRASQSSLQRSHPPTYARKASEPHSCRIAHVAERVAPFRPRSRSGALSRADGR